MLGPNGEADGSPTDALLNLLSRTELGVGGACRVYDQGFHISDVRKQGEQLESVNEGLRFLLPPHYVEGEDRGSSLGEVPGIEVVIGIVSKGGVSDYLYFGMACQEGHYPECVVVVSLDPQRKGFQALEE